MEVKCAGIKAQSGPYLHTQMFNSDLQLLDNEVKSGMGSPDWHATMFNIHLQRLLWMYGLGHAGTKGKDSGAINHHNWPAFRQI